MSDFWSKVQRGEPDKCWPFIAKSRTGNGYGLAWANLGSGAKVHTAHRVAFYLSAGRPAVSGTDIMHSCDNRICCNPAHLSEGSRADNMRDCAAKGRTRKTPTIFGDRHHKAKLTLAAVAKIKADLIGGRSFGDLGREHGVSGDVIGCIARGQTWKHVTPTPIASEEPGQP